MKKLLLFAFFLLFLATAFAQDIDKVISVSETERIETVLSSDDMRGRRVFTPDIEKAAAFIIEEFGKAGLQPSGNPGSYLQEFALVRPALVSASVVFDGRLIDDKKVIVATSQASLHINQASGYEITGLNSGDNLFSKASMFIQSGKNYIVLVDTAHAKNFSRLAFFTRQLFKSPYSVIFVLGEAAPENFSVSVQQQVKEAKLANVVGVLPGKSKKEEYVVFSAHYDHLGVRAPVNGDSIYNGANDDASGTTAVIMLAKYFATLKNNERTLVFAAFTAEELGAFGSQYFSRQIDPGKVVAMINIEMIGTESKWGKNSAYITGYEKTDMGKIIQHNLEGSAFTLYPDPYTDQNLFYRSDNAMLARLGVPAHSISTSKMDNEPNYHKAGDEIGTLDILNMAAIIKAIAVGSKSIAGGEDTPTRINMEDNGE